MRNRLLRLRFKDRALARPFRQNACTAITMAGKIRDHWGRALNGPSPHTPSGRRKRADAFEHVPRGPSTSWPQAMNPASSLKTATVGL